MTEDLNEGASYCPACGAEYRAGFETCADDGTPLVAGPVPEDFGEEAEPEQPESPRILTGARWVRLTDVPGEEEARLLAGRLEAEGIEANISPDWQSDMYGRATNALLGKRIEIYVLEDRVAQAAQIIQELQRS